jgi:hypothetical protein
MSPSAEPSQCCFAAAAGNKNLNGNSDLQQTCRAVSTNICSTHHLAVEKLG